MMWLAVFYIWGSLLAFSVCHICPETSEDVASWVTLKPLGHCGDEENLCPYQLTLPPLSIQLPRPFRELENMAKELQDLKEVVNQLRRDCQECKDRHSIQRSGQKEYGEEKERRLQIPRHNISIKETQSHSGEQVVRILTSTLLQGDTSESEGTIKDGVKRLDHSILESQEWNIAPRIFPNQGTRDQRSEVSREVKIFNPSLDETPEDTSKVKQVLSPTPEESERELKSKQSVLIEPALPRKKDPVQSSSHGKQQPNIFRDGHVKNISGILTARRRVQYGPDSNGLSSISRDANTKIMDLSTSAGNRRVVKFPGAGGSLRPKGSYINSRVLKVTNEDRLKNPALVRVHNLQSGDMTVKPEPEEAGFSPVRSGIMQVKETSPRTANTKPSVFTGPTLSTDDQNNQDISMVSGPRTDDGHVLNVASQVAKIMEDNSRKVNKTVITRLPTNLRKENQGDVSHIATNKSIPSVMNQAEQPNMIKDEEKHMGLSESLVAISSEEETSSNLNREDLTFLERQVENEKYLNPITETNNRQTDLKKLDKADSTFNEGRVLVGKTDPQSGDMMVKPEPEETGFSPARGGVMRVKEASPRIANTKPGAISGPTLSTDDQNKHTSDISRLSGPRTDDGHGLKDARQVTKVREDNLRKVNKSGIIKLPTKLGKENQGDVSHIATNKSISTVMNQGEQPNMVKEEKRHMGLSESLVVISSEEEISSKVDREDLTFPGIQVENVKYLNPIIETNNRQIDSTVLDKADRTFNESTVNPLSPDLKDQMQLGTFIERANKHIGVNSQSAGTMKKDIPSHGKATLPEKDLVKPTLVPTVKRKLTDSTVSITRRVQSQVVRQGTKRISVTPLKAPAGKGPFQNSRKNISKIRGHVISNPLRHPDRHLTTVISHRVNKLRQPNVRDNMSANKSVGVHSQLSIPVRNTNIARKNGSGIIKPSYIRSLNFQTEPNTTRGFKTKVSTVTQFYSPTGATEQKQTEEIKPIPLAMRSNVLDNKWLKNNSTESQSQPESQNSSNVQDLDKVQQSKNQLRDKSETGSTEDHNNLQSGASNSPTGGKESKIFNLGNDDTSNQQPFEVDKISNGKKGPTAPTLKKESSKESGTNRFTTSTVSFMDTNHEDSPKNIIKVTNTHVEMAKNDSSETPISFESIGATRELELIQFNKDRVVENSGEILSNPNSADTAQSYSGERYTDPVVLETLTNVEEIKGSKLFSLSPEDTAEGFKSHAVSDEVTGREQVKNKIHSTCDSDCNTTSTQQSTAKTRPPVNSGREKGPAQDCADYITKSQRNGVYRVTPQPKSSMFPVFCDMESSGGGWTLIQHRFDGSTSFNRTWDEYKNGFGKLIGEFWLGNDKIHLLTKAKNVSLRIEIEDSEGIKEYAHYDHFYVANESQQYRLSIGGYSGTAGNAMQFNKKYNHDQKLFTTPDRDNDQYPSGNCGAYYSSGWWFDACMSANLNGRYYQSKYKGLRNGIFWGTWHNITMEYYPTNERQSFKTVKMMIRPKNFAK
uniref:Fibrinogen-like 2b n=2 Tax=Cyprinus carpio carpio TaxID=630221 RepID=A0A9J7YFH9_CYPCA